MFQAKLWRKPKYILFSTVFFFDNSAVCVRVLKNITESDSLQMMMIWCMCIACWIPKATNSGYVIILAFPLQQRVHERAAMIRYTHIACLVLYISVPHHPGSQSWLYSISNLHTSLSFLIPSVSDWLIAFLFLLDIPPTVGKSNVRRHYQKCPVLWLVKIRDLWFPRRISRDTSSLNPIKPGLYGKNGTNGIPKKALPEWILSYLAINITCVNYSLLIKTRKICQTESGASQCSIDVIREAGFLLALRLQQRRLIIRHCGSERLVIFTWPELLHLT